MKLKKKVKYGLIAVVSIVVVALIVTTIFNVAAYYKDVDVAFKIVDEYADEDEELVAHIQCAEAEVDATQLIEYSTSDDSNLSVEADPTSINLNFVGEQEITYSIDTENDKGRKIEKVYNVTVYVEDTEAPVIELESEDITLSKGASFNPEDNVKVTDNSEVCTLVTKKPNKTTKENEVYTTSWYMIDSDVDTSTPGEYTVKVTACDKYGNEAEPKTFSVTVDNKKALSTYDSDTHVSYNTDSILVVANKKNALPDGYEPSDLRVVNTPNTNNWKMRDEAATALEEMFAAAKEDGITLIACSGYRSQSYQVTLYNSYVSKYGRATADTISSRPGYSDHQTGLAMDIGDHDQATVFSSDMQYTPEGEWLYKNAHNYGFILRYPKGKDDITGYTFEPWHYRYIGVEDATKLYNISPDYTLEEYLGVEGGYYDE